MHARCQYGVDAARIGTHGRSVTQAAFNAANALVAHARPRPGTAAGTPRPASWPASSGNPEKEHVMNATARHAARLLAPALLLVAALVPAPGVAQEPGEVMVSIYRVAPGKHLDFLRWQAARDAAGSEAGVAATQWYAHLDGDSWDYLSIGPTTTDEQDDKVESILKGRKLTTGFKASIEFRTMIASHTDTRARGPTTAAALVEAGK
jgi:hypothetical protein